MPSEKQIQDTFDRVAQDVPGFIAASLVDLDSGMTLGARSLRADFDLTAASAYNSEMVKQKLKIMKALKLETVLEDMILTLGDQIHLIKLVSPTTFIYLAADRAHANLAIVRNAVTKHAAAFS
jgi:predicted regulator of Ras-like GTPase activity (Roadblock/LC7/MglB family)